MVDYATTGRLERHSVPSNDSCLFSAIHFCLTRGGQTQDSLPMRKIIAEKVAADPIQYDKAFLGQSNSDYCKWILNTRNWGGAIEVSILSKYYQKEIVVADIESARLNRFGEDYQYPERILLIYDGAHYDAFAFKPFDPNSPIETIFSCEHEEILAMALDNIHQAKEAKKFTNTGGMTMKCAVCGESLNMETAAQHAGKTGHVEFEEIG